MNEDILVPSWDQYFMNLVDVVATRSKDRSTKVGAVFVGPENESRTTGYNSFPRGLDDNVPARHERPEKYLWTEHAERNAIYNAARIGTPLRGCKVYLPFAPCMDCARAMVAVGCYEVIAKKLDEASPLYQRWKTDFERIDQLFHETGVNFRWFE